MSNKNIGNAVEKQKNRKMTEMENLELIKMQNKFTGGELSCGLEMIEKGA